MYEKDKKTRITVRLNEQQFETVKTRAEILGVSPSDFIRMLVNAVGYAEKKTDELANKILEGSSRENDKTNSDDIV